MTNSKARAFAALHRPGEPLILFNAWDAGSARTVEAAGAKAIATASWAVAAANGFEDGESLPLDLALDNLGRIVAATDLAVTIDLERGYADAPASARAAAEAGAVGCNVEDGLAEGGITRADDQCECLLAIRKAVGADFFLNARTDLFLQAKPDLHPDLVKQALDRAHAYAEAGASGLFVPGLADPDLIATVCAKSPLPVNVMAGAATPPRARLAALGVARISHGPGPWRLAMKALGDAARAAFA